MELKTIKNGFVVLLFAERKVKVSLEMKMHTVGMWEASPSLKPTMCPRQRKYNYNRDCMVAIF